MSVRLIALFVLAAASLLSQADANADIIRCNDANGKTLYTDSACPDGMRVVGSTPYPQSCASEDCERRRERDRKEAYERVRAEKDQLAAYAAARHKREIEDRWLDEARYEAELRSSEATQTAADEAVYPVYPVFGILSRCGTHCIAFPRQRNRLPSRIGTRDHGHHHMNSLDGHIRTARNLPLRSAAKGNRTVPSARLAINMK